ncbi:MAG TPA: hypothetical protein VG165_17665 [Solirubrobacteraceae bacterium]|nr:hypothetical protein [Solirubrobacteraceae bacterium]
MSTSARVDADDPIELALLAVDELRGFLVACASSDRPRSTGSSRSGARVDGAKRLLAHRPA